MNFMKVKKICLNDNGVLIPGHLIKRLFRRPVFYPFAPYDEKCGFNYQIIHNKDDLVEYDISAFVSKDFSV